MSIVFYWHPMSSASPIASALAELNVPHQRIKVDIHAGEQRHPDYLALNPNGAVPTLTVDGAPMFEALAIHLWLAERYGVEQGVWPAADTAERLQAMSWCVWSYVTYGAAVWQLSVATLSECDPARRDAKQAEQALQQLDRLLGVLDGHLAQRTWMLGTSWSLVDLVVGSVLGYSAFLGAPIARHAHVQTWLEAVQARASMQAEQG